MRKLTLTTLALLFSICALAQIHQKKMLLFLQDPSAPILNVYDIKKESLLKVINTGEPIIYTKFNSDETKLYALGKKFVYVIDVNSLEMKKIQLLSDEDDNIPFGNGMADITMNKVTHPIGISAQGIAVYMRTTMDAPKGKVLYWVFNVSSGEKKFSAFHESVGGSFTNSNLYFPEQDGNIRVVNPVTKLEVKKLPSAFDANALALAKTEASAREDKNVSLHLTPWGTRFFLTNVYRFDAGYNLIPTCSVYDLIAQKVLYSEKLVSAGAAPDVVPVLSDNQAVTYFQRSEPLDPNMKAPEMPLMPKQPDFANMKPKAMMKASEAYQAEAAAFQAKVGEWKIKFQEFSNPKNSRVKVFSDAACTQHLLSIEGVKYCTVYGDMLIAGKEVSIEIYDMKTKKLIHTIYMV